VYNGSIAFMKMRIKIIIAGFIIACLLSFYAIALTINKAVVIIFNL